MPPMSDETDMEEEEMMMMEPEMSGEGRRRSLLQRANRRNRRQAASEEPAAEEEDVAEEPALEEETAEEPAAEEETAEEPAAEEPTAEEPAEDEELPPAADDAMMMPPMMDDATMEEDMMEPPAAEVGPIASAISQAVEANLAVVGTLARVVFGPEVTADVPPEMMQEAPSRRFSRKLLQAERPPVINVIAGVMQGMSNVAQAFVEQAAAPLIETVVPVEDVLTVMDDADAVGMSVLDSFAPLEEALESAFEG